MKKLYENPSLDILNIEVNDVLEGSGLVNFGGSDSNEVVEDWPW